MKSVVLAEKPSVARELARVLNCRPQGKSFFEGDRYLVTWAMGHLVELADPEDYEDRWRNWDLKTLPMLPDKMKLKVIRKTSFQFNAIKNLLQRRDVDNLIIATDAGREGELVARWIQRLCGYKGPFQRLWISSQTDKAIKEGFAALKPGHDFDCLLHAAESRAEADWIIGLNITRALSCQYDSRLSAGRVQTPTLAMIVEREKEIRQFTPQPFWTIQADFGRFKAGWQGPNGQNRFTDKNRAEELAAGLSQKTALIASIQSTDSSEPPPLLYDLTALQREANSILSFPAKKTLSVLQSLYERHKIATYPRTDSRHITTDMVPTLKDRLLALELTPFAAQAKEILQKGVNPGKQVVDNSKVTDHHAIIPTEEKVRMERLDADEKALFSLIAARFLAALSKPCLSKKITVNLDLNGEKFTVKGKEITDPGWRQIRQSFVREEEEDEFQVMKLSGLKEGEKIPVVKVNAVQGFTQPPPRFTEGTLLAMMENPKPLIKDKALKDSTGKIGLGTPATRADIIEKLFSNYYIERSGREIVPTAQGTELVRIVPEELRSPELTARWELRLSEIAEGREKPSGFLQDIRSRAAELVTQVTGTKNEFKPVNASGKKCPLCGRGLVAAKGKKGQKLLVCLALSCGYEEDEFQKDDLSRKPGRKEHQITQKLIRKYTDNDVKDTFTLGDLLKKQEEEKNRRKDKKK